MKMKTKVIPTLFALNKKQFDIKLNKLSFLDELHIDFMDGKFVENKSVSINSMNEISKFPNINFQIHLMAKNTLKLLNKIKKFSNIKTVFFQIESFYSNKELEETIKEYRENNFKVGLVLNPKTKVSEIEFYLDQIDVVMFMSVWPGAEGQSFIEEVLEEVKILRKKFPLLNIQIDGGINSDTILLAKKAGVNIFCVGSYVSGGENVKEKYEELIELIK